MVKNRNALALLVALGITLGVVGLLLSGAGPVAAQVQDPSATRSLSATTVAPGGEIVVSISADRPITGQVIETLPEGFSYVSSGLPSTLIASSGQDVRVTLIGGSSFSYTVSASDVPGSYDFMGRVSVIDVASDSTEVFEVYGRSNVVVEATAPEPEPSPGNGGGTAPNAMRTLSADSVQQGGQFMVTVTTGGIAGRVLETLPAGFSYVDGSSNLPDSAVTVTGQDVQFTVVGHQSFDYSAMASNVPGTYAIMGVLTVVDFISGSTMDYPMGDTAIMVEAAGPIATRSLPDEPVEPGAEFTVTIMTGGTTGRVVETLPEGFSYVGGSSSLLAAAVSASGQDVSFTVVGQRSFTYSVMASDVDGTYAIMGVLTVVDVINSTTVDHPIPDSTIVVGMAPEPSPVTTPEATGTPKPSVRTPRPTAVPSAPATPVAIEKADVTAAEGATVVQPDASAMISSSDGMATVMLPNTSRARTYQVMVSSDMAGCSGVAGSLQACAAITSYDAEGNMESGVMLIRRATVVMMLNSSAVEDLGGLPVVFQANALGAFNVYQMGAGGPWGMRRFSMGLTEDGGIAVTVTGLRTLGSLALAVDEKVLEQAYNQVKGITPTPPPVPTAPPPTVAPTAPPAPTQTPVPPVDVDPVVGDTTLPVGLLVVLALTGALMAYTGSRIMRSRRPTAS